MQTSPFMWALDRYKESTCGSHVVRLNNLPSTIGYFKSTDNPYFSYQIRWANVSRPERSTMIQLTHKVHFCQIIWIKLLFCCIGKIFLLSCMHSSFNSAFRQNKKKKKVFFFCQIIYSQFITVYISLDPWAFLRCALSACQTHPLSDNSIHLYSQLKVLSTIKPKLLTRCDTSNLLLMDHDILSRLTTSNLGLWKEQLSLWYPPPKWVALSFFDQLGGVSGLCQLFRDCNF